MSEFLKASELTESRAFVHSFVKEVRVEPCKATIIYSIPLGILVALLPARRHLLRRQLCRSGPPKATVSGR